MGITLKSTNVVPIFILPLPKKIPLKAKVYTYSERSKVTLLIWSTLLFDNLYSFFLGWSTSYLTTTSISLFFPFFWSPFLLLNLHNSRAGFRNDQKNNLY